MAAAASPTKTAAPIGQIGVHHFDSNTLPDFMSSAGPAGWVIVDQPDSTLHTKALRAKVITYNQYTQFSFNINTLSTNGSFSIRTKVSSEQDYDFFSVFIDGLEAAARSGQDGGYVNISFDLFPGVHNIVFKYSEDFTVSSGHDTVFISQIIIS